MSDVTRCCGPVWPGAGPGPGRKPAAAPATAYPSVTFGVVSFLQYAAELHERDGYNAFDVTRGYFNIEAQPLGPCARPVHAGRAPDDRRQPRSEPGAAPGIRRARRRR